MTLDDFSWGRAGQNHVACRSSAERTTGVLCLKRFFAWMWRFQDSMNTNADGRGASFPLPIVSGIDRNQRHWSMIHHDHQRAPKHHDGRGVGDAIIDLRSRSLVKTGSPTRRR